ncbi:hypothetical protein AB0J38_11385 [Streptomyces sp. NPDC050095]|uniref:hypothetical protein n=1 Tax=unclassified Streptomyces TaxID=2593676 RepID=UPI003445A599
MRKSSSQAGLVEAGFAAWLIATLASQHPNRIFQGPRRYDRFALMLPDWRFFAPKPAAYDFHLLYRTLSTFGGRSQWKPASQIADRRWFHAVWNPRIRLNKTLFDICSEALHYATHMEKAELLNSSQYKLLKAFVRERVCHGEDLDVVSGFQFLVLQYSGYDDSENPRYVFISPFERWTVRG